MRERMDTIETVIEKNNNNKKDLATLNEEVQQLSIIIAQVQKGKAPIELIRSKFAIVINGMEIISRVNFKKQKIEEQKESIESLIESCKKANKKNLSRLNRAVDKLLWIIDLVQKGRTSIECVMDGLEFINEGVKIIFLNNAALESYKTRLAEGVQQ